MNWGKIKLNITNSRLKTEPSVVMKNVYPESFKSLTPWILSPDRALSYFYRESEFYFAVNVKCTNAFEKDLAPWVSR